MQRRSSKKKHHIYERVYYSVHIIIDMKNIIMNCGGRARDESLSRAVHRMAQINQRAHPHTTYQRQIISLLSLYTCIFLPHWIVLHKGPGWLGPRMDAFTMTICVDGNQKYYYYILWPCINGFTAGFLRIFEWVWEEEGVMTLQIYVITALTKKNTWNSGIRGVTQVPRQFIRQSGFRLIHL